MKKLLLLLFSLLLSFNSYGEVELDFSSDTFCDQSPKAQVRNGLFYLPNQEEPYSGENLCVYLSNGQYYNKGEIKDGLRHGSWSFWKENGQKLNDKTFLEDRVISETKYEYYENGQILSKETVKNGKQDGISTFWFENGQKMFERTFKDGELDGITIAWYENGQKALEGNILNGVPDGIAYSWYENGQLNTQLNFLHGKEHGKQTKWYENGQLQGEVNYNNSVPDGNWISWFENGLENGKGFFENGTGEFNEYFESGEKAFQLFYKDGFGIQTFWYKNGQKESQANFINGKLEGRWTYWNEKGFTLEEQQKLDDEKAKLNEEERFRLDELEAERTALQLAYENEQYNRLLTQEVQAEQDQERLLVIEDQLNTLKSAYVSNIAARIKSFWRYQGAEDDWTAEVYIVQDRDGTVVAVDVRNSNVDNSNKAKVFEDSIRRAVYKASPLPSAPDEAVFDDELIFIFSVN